MAQPHRAGHHRWVNIGIAGLISGPQMVCEARRDIHPRLRMHFVSNVDAGDLDRVLGGLDGDQPCSSCRRRRSPRRRRSHGTPAARAWFRCQVGAQHGLIGLHFVAVTTNLPAAGAFGIAEVCWRWDWVGAALFAVVGRRPEHDDRHRRRCLSGLLLAGTTRWTNIRHRPADQSICLPAGAGGCVEWQFLGAPALRVAPYAQVCDGSGVSATIGNGATANPFSGARRDAAGRDQW